MKLLCKKDFTLYKLGVTLKITNIKQLICKIWHVVEIPAQKVKGCQCNQKQPKKI